MTDAAWGSLSDQAVTACGLVYFLALLAYLVEWAALRDVPADVPIDQTTDRVRFASRLAPMLVGIAVAIHLVALLSRGMAADPNRVPWGNMYEFTVSGSFVVAALFLAFNKRFGLSWLGPLVITFVVAVLMVAMIWLHEAVAPLTEALSSYWLVIHVISAVIATGAFTLGGIVSAAYLVKERSLARVKVGPDGEPIEAPRGYVARLPAPRDLDRIAYRMHAFGFPVWTFAVLITGPIWAHEAWSSYWNWDPKEVWAFITWVVYAAYLHARSTAGWRGRNAAMLALVGVATLWFNFIGINYFSSTSQHSYARAPATSVVSPSAGVETAVADLLDRRATSV